ncbi:hypothetical protein ACIP5Y_09905 [Nocardia sp. NPDC088792]|uniref:hypothetical protein n=1 Tax=Nocardia sp. NPDC088792 TaxID=3364332 RepID=UPI0037FCDF08
MGTPTRDQVVAWNPQSLADVATAADSIMTSFDTLADTMNRTIHDLDWSGAAAKAALGRADNEKQQIRTVATAYSNLADACSGAYAAMQPGISDLQSSIRALENDRFTVDQDFTVHDNLGDKERQEDAKNDTARLQSIAQSLGQSDDAWSAKIATAVGEIEKLAPVTKLNNPLIGLLMGGMGRANPVPDSLDPLSMMLKLNNGIPVTVDDPDGSKKTITPNPDGTVTVAQATHGPDGSTTTTSSTNSGPATTTVMTPRGDGSGIVDVAVTGPDGKTQRLRTVPQADGHNATFAVNGDGTLGAKMSESYRAADGGVITDVVGKNGVLDRSWQRPDGFVANERYLVGPDGQRQLVGTSNSARMHSVLQADGTIKTTYPDGRTAQTAQLPDGRVVTKFEDGSMLSYDPGRAAPGVPHQSMWDNVKAFTGGHWDGLVSSTQGTVDQHPVETGLGGAASAGSEAANRAGQTMAGRAAAAAGESAAKQILANTMLDNGAPGAGRAAVQALDASADAANGYAAADALKAGGKWLGWPATIGINSYVNWDDWAHHDKPMGEAIGNAVGSSVGGMAGAWMGAKVGAVACSPFAEVPIVPVLCAVGGAAVGGFLGGSAGGYAGEQPFK